MTLVEAQELLSLIALDLKQSQLMLKPVAGDDEWVIILKKSNFHIWGPADWHRYQATLEEQRQRRGQARAGV